MLPQAAAGLWEALGGHIASSQNRPPTRHIRAAGLSPGPEPSWPLALIWKTPPYGFPEEKERRKARGKNELCFLWVSGPFSGRDLGVVSLFPSRSKKRKKGAINETSDS